MVNTRWLFVVVGILLLGICSVKVIPVMQQKMYYKNFEIVEARFGNMSHKLLVADTPQKWEQGLMYYKKLPYVDGMIFIFPDKQLRTFWNKNTFMDLKIYWIDNGKVVGTSDLPSIDKTKTVFTVSSPSAVDEVVEMP